MFNPLTRVLGNKQTKTNKTQNNNQNNQPTNQNRGEGENSTGCEGRFPSWNQEYWIALKLITL